MKAQIMLVVSPKMDSNRKKDRGEDGLIRLGSKAREALGLGKEKTVELWPDNKSTDDRINRARVLSIFEAYKEDLKGLKESGASEEEYLRSGFVTSKTFETICRDRSKKRESIWVADTITETVIGSDPEFLLLDDKGHVVSANGYLPYGGEFGCDGYMAELRPKPAISPADFVKNIRDLFKSEYGRKIKDLKWVAACCFDGTHKGGGHASIPVGGHVHIGSPLMFARTMDKMGAAVKSAAYQCLKKLLDEYIAVPAMKLDGIEESVARRKDHGYGKFHDIRTDHGRLEWRTPSGIWMAHPLLAEAFLGVSKAVSQAFFLFLEEGGYEKELLIPKGIVPNEKYLSDMPGWMLAEASFEGWNAIPVTKEFEAVIPTKIMASILLTGGMEFNKAYFTRLAKLFKGLPTYKEYRKEIEVFLEVVALSEEDLKENLDRDIKGNWMEKKKFIVE